MFIGQKKHRLRVSKASSKSSTMSMERFDLYMGATLPEGLKQASGLITKILTGILQFLAVGFCISSWCAAGSKYSSSRMGFFFVWSSFMVLGFGLVSFLYVFRIMHWGNWSHGFVSGYFFLLLNLILIVCVVAGGASIGAYTATVVFGCLTSLQMISLKSIYISFKEWQCVIVRPE